MTPAELIAKAQEHDAKARELRAQALMLEGHSEREHEAIRAAASVIKFGSADYLNGLWDVLRALLPPEVFALCQPGEPEFRMLAGFDEEGDES